jgi:hypothetical protein
MPIQIEQAKAQKLPFSFLETSGGEGIVSF